MDILDVGIYTPLSKEKEMSDFIENSFQCDICKKIFYESPRWQVACYSKNYCEDCITDEKRSRKM